MRLADLEQLIVIESPMLEYSDMCYTTVTKNLSVIFVNNFFR